MDSKTGSSAQEDREEQSKSSPILEEDQTKTQLDVCVVLAGRKEFGLPCEQSPIEAVIQTRLC